ANLARIKLAEDETEKFQKDLSEILDYFNLLNEVGVANVQPMIHSVKEENVLRQDIAAVANPALAQKLLEAAPATERGFIKVKSILSE
ncbi:MAG: Asp-tRNA(Asn)/Glu-tRNA(Gln) amidotransferase subunit GatC, partial [Candidatus Wildermuthbacteria bacterium]|nr:Asp-tRNA(Asn)/Glu-tRNA(Gln) amidotransferase subunit GatC [Candidatus Wildermuthbacteria bacterium]